MSWYCRHLVNCSKLFEMIGTETEENMNSEQLVVLSKSNVTHEQAVPRGKRKLLYDHFDSLCSEDQKACKKGQTNEEISLNTENGSLPTRIEVVVLNGKWDTSETISSIFAEMHGVTIQDLDVNECCIPRSEISGTEIIIEDVGGILTQCSERTACKDSDLDFSESPPLTENSDRQCKHINDSETNCDDNLSWLINFKVGSLFNADEVEHDHNYKGREEEEVICPGMC